MAVLVGVQVPVDAAGDLNELMQNVTVLEQPVTVRPFDGAAVVQTVLSVAGGGGSLAFFKVWMKARVERRKNVKIVYEGVEFDGLNDRQLDQVINMIEKKLNEDDPPPSN